MIDDSIIQLLEASKTVNIYMRNVEVDPADTVRQGHFDCACGTVPPMSGNRSYLTTKLKLMARDGCEAQIGFVWSPDDQAWTMVENDTLEYQILYTAGRFDAYIDPQHLLNGDTVYVRLVNMDGVTRHVNRRVSFLTFAEEFTGDDPAHEVVRIQVATTSPAPLPVGVYIDPAYVSMTSLRTWMDTGRIDPRVYAATPTGAARMRRIGLLPDRTANNMVKLEVPEENQHQRRIDDARVADIVEGALRGHRERMEQLARDNFAMAFDPRHEPEWYDEDDDGL